MTKVLFCCVKNEYGKPSSGISYEYSNFYETLAHMPNIEVSGYFFDEEITRLGKVKANQLLIERVCNEQPDILFLFLFTDQILPETLRLIKKQTKTKLVNWFGDDHWRVPVYSRYWAPLFDLVTTTDTQAVKLYKKYGITNVFKTQWAANHFTYKPQNNDNNTRDWHITFLGQNYGIRSDYIKTLQQAHLPVRGFGKGFEEKVENVQKMFEVFSFSKINLNFSETPYITPKSMARLFLSLSTKKSPEDKWVGWKVWDIIRAVHGAQRRTIKGRVFQVPSCGGFLLTGYTDEDISEYYEPNKEIVIFKNKEELISKCKYYLEHESEREHIAEAGHARTLSDHTYEKRFNQIFEKVL